MTPEEIKRLQEWRTEGRRQGLAEAAQVCADIHEREWAEYRRTRDGYREGAADYAGECELAIRKLLDQPSVKSPGKDGRRRSCQ